MGEVTSMMVRGIFARRSILYSSRDLRRGIPVGYPGVVIFGDRDNGEIEVRYTGQPALDAFRSAQSDRAYLMLTDEKGFALQYVKILERPVRLIIPRAQSDRSVQVIQAELAEKKRPSFWRRAPGSDW